MCNKNCVGKECCTCKDGYVCLEVKCDKSCKTEDKRLIRRIDDLGRIVIPKQLRRELKINEGDSFEIKIVPEGIMIMSINSKS